MELLILIILYYLSQNPDFERSVKPLLGELKNSENALKFLEELSQFSRLFSAANAQKDGGRSASNATASTKPNEQNPSQSPHASTSQNSKESQAQSQNHSPTAGIADGFIEELLSKYFQ
jgi:hypothetical protein